MTDKTQIRGVSVVLTTEGAQYEQGMAAAQASLERFTAANQNASARIAKHSKTIQQAGLNLSRQFTDIGVQLAGGQSPFLVLTQQLPQMADAFAQAKSQGVGFKGVVGGLANGIKPLVPALAGAGLAVGAVVGAFALFERAVDKQTKGATTWGDTWKATLKVVGDRIMDGPIGAGLKWMGAAFSATFDAITRGITWFADNVVGHLGASFQLVVQNWRRLPEVFGVIIQGAANVVIRGVEGLVNTSIKGLNHLLKGVGLGALGLIDLPEIRVANAQLAGEYDKLSKQVAGSFKKGRESLFSDIVRQTEREAAARKKAEKGAGDHARAVKKDREEIDAWTKEVADAQAEGLKFAAALRIEAAETGLGTRELKLRNIALQEMIAISRGLPGVAAEIRAAGEAWTQAFDAEQAKAGLKDMEAALDAYLGRLKDVKDETRSAAEVMSEAFRDVRYSISDMVRSLKSGDIGRVVLNIQSLQGGLQSLLQGGAQGGLQVASIVANAIGGRTGRAIGGGLGIAATGVGLGTALGAGGALAGIGAALGPGIVAALGPIGIAAGALYAAAKLLNVGGKPSNKGAGFDLVTGQLSGNKRSAETEEAARGAGEAILGIQDALKAAGIGLTDTVRGLVIGTRDASQIYLASGRMLTSAVGDSGAAVDTALRALLDGATYVSEAQRKLVESALATGKGFDAIAEVLAKYEAAQKISGELADRILALTDPKAFELDQVKAAIEAERKAAEQLARDGVLTADQLATINSQLDQLQALELDAVLARYAEAVEDAGEAARRAAETQLEYAEGSWEDAVAALEASRDAEVAALEKTRDELLKTADSLADFRKDVLGEIVGAGDPRRALQAARTAFAANTDPSKIPELGRALLAASQAGASSAVELARDRAAVLAQAERAETLARAEAGAIERQIAAIHLQVGALLPLTPAVQSLDTSIGKLQAAAEALAAAQAAHAAAFAQAAQAMNDNLTAATAAAATGFDASAVSAAVSPAARIPAAEVSASAVATPEDVQLRQLVVLQAIESILGDVSQGGDALRISDVAA